MRQDWIWTSWWIRGEWISGEIGRRNGSNVGRAVVAQRKMKAEKEAKAKAKAKL